MKRAFEYMMANKELFTIRSRTTQGIRNAKENGRYLGRAPFGYKNIKDGAKNNLIEIDLVQSKIVKKIFQEYLLGIEPHQILKNIKPLGFIKTGNSIIHDILKNCTYAGLIKVPAHKQVKEKYVSALHSPIISAEDYWSIQKKLIIKRPQKVRINEDFPLRGILKCTCGKKLTAAWSKGRKEYYLYYKCTGHPNSNIAGKIIHEKFEQLLKTITLQQYQVDYIKQIAQPLLSIPLKDHRSKTEGPKAVESVVKKIAQLEEKFICNQLDYPTYNNWIEKFKIEKQVLENALKRASLNETRRNAKIEEFFSGKISVYKIYSRCTVSQKHSLIQSIFRDKLVWDNNKFSTSFFNPSLQHDLKKVLDRRLLSFSEPLKLI